MKEIKKIKVLYTIPNFDTAGSGKVVYDLVKHIDKTKFEPHICCTHTKGAFFNQIKSLGVSIHIFNFNVPYRPFFSLPRRVWKIRNFFKKHNFDIIHSWHWSSDITEPIASKLAGIPFVYTKKAMSWGNKSWRWRSQLSKKIICINSDMKTEFFPNMMNKIIEIPIGLNVGDFGILEKSYSDESSYTVDDDFVIVSIANLVDVKGIEYLLEAVHRLNNPRIKVFIVGDDTSDYAKRLKLKYTSSNSIFTGKTQNIKTYLALGDVFVIPTKDEGRKEGQPIAPIEAMLSGRIVLGSRISGIKDVLEPFQKCLFQPNSVDDVKEKLEMILKMDEKTRKDLALKMYQYASKKYTIEHSIERHEALYKNLSKHDI